MKCKRCGETVHTDEAELVADDFDFEVQYCHPCAVEVWQQDQIYNNPPQDEGDGPESGQVDVFVKNESHLS